jgi:hypothetical protein
MERDSLHSATRVLSWLEPGFSFMGRTSSHIITPPVGIRVVRTSGVSQQGLELKGGLGFGVLLDYIEYSLYILVKRQSTK